ncbi:MAG: hypothetical protein K2K26_04510 [Muribaculaceae bacterium]|nr:hypothetical protein [Muribaculaceae bacterium]
MEIVKIYVPNLYAIRYNGDKLNIYKLVYERLTDADYLQQFFDTFKDRISKHIVSSLGYPREETEEYISEVHDRMIDIVEEIQKICCDIRNGKAKDFGTMFEPHSRQDLRQLPAGGGSSTKYALSYLPVKCWGSGRKPSLVRVYAIELALDCYIIIYGGIKIDLDTNCCPTFDRNGNETTLENELYNRVTSVARFLTEKGIIDKEGLTQYMDEDYEDR